MSDQTHPPHSFPRPIFVSFALESDSNGSSNGSTPFDFLINAMTEQMFSSPESSNNPSETSAHSDNTNRHSPVFFMMFSPIINIHTADAMNHMQGQPAASKFAINHQLQTVTLTEKDIHSHPQCAVCLDTFHTSESVSKLPCSHIYHAKCLNTWLKQSNTCPHCRYELLTDNEEYNQGVRNRMAERQVVFHDEDCGMHAIGCCSHQEETDPSFKKDVKMSGCGHRFHAGCLQSALRIAGYSNVQGHMDQIRCPGCRQTSSVTLPVDLQ